MFFLCPCFLEALRFALVFCSRVDNSALVPVALCLFFNMTVFDLCRLSLFSSLAPIGAMQKEQGNLRRAATRKALADIQHTPPWALYADRQLCWSGSEQDAPGTASPSLSP